ncbi:hypothetical protein D9M72_196980 [compost metagenome]
MASTAVLQCDRREHTVRGAGQVREHALGVACVLGLAEDGAAERDRGVGAEHGRIGQAEALAARDGGIELEGGHALHVRGGRLVRQQGFERLGVFVGTGQQQFVAHAELAEQLGAARALRREVDEVRQVQVSEVGPTAGPVVIPGGTDGPR